MHTHWLRLSLTELVADECLLSTMLAVLPLLPPLLVAHAGAVGQAAMTTPGLPEFWKRQAHFEFVSKARFSGPDGQFGMNVGFDIVPQRGTGTWHLFHREYGFTAGPKPYWGICDRDHARIVVRSSSDEGRTWSNASVVASPVGSGPAACALVDGAAFWDESQRTWHYLAQCLAPNSSFCEGCGGWQLCHYSAVGDPNPATADWKPTFNATHPSVVAGSLWASICEGRGKHCDSRRGNDNVGTVDEGTPQIVSKDAATGDFFVTFHGWDPHTVRSARGVARTRDFVNWQTSGNGLPQDAIMSRTDCMKWSSNNFSWAPSGCVGGGEGSILKASDGLMYQLIEAPDISLGCEGAKQNWVLGLSRAASWLPSGHWEQFEITPTVVPSIKQGCFIQYHRIFEDTFRNTTYLECAPPPLLLLPHTRSVCAINKASQLTPAAACRCIF